MWLVFTAQSRTVGVFLQVILPVPLCQYDSTRQAVARLANAIKHRLILHQRYWTKWHITEEKWTPQKEEELEHTPAGVSLSIPTGGLIKPRPAGLGLGCQGRDWKQPNIKCRCLFAVIMTFPCACTNSLANDLFLRARPKINAIANTLYPLGFTAGLVNG